MLRVHLFGGLDLLWGERTLPPFPGAAVRSLLAYLLTYHDRPHTRDLLAGTFWPDLPDATARRRLSQALWQIRHQWQQAVGREKPAAPPLLQTGRTSVKLNPDLPLWLDTEEFARLHALSTARAPGAMEAGLRAVELYRGEFLAGYYDDWAIPQRERLHGMLLEVLGRLLEDHKVLGEYESALAYARRLAAEDPWYEGAHREVMRLCHLAGRDGEALAQYEACRRVLAEELGSEPAPETAAMAAEIAARAGLPAPPLLPSSARAVRAPLLERPDLLPLVGRRAEMAELVRQVELAAAGTGGLTVVYGEAGVGKSRLLREVAANAEWRGLRVAWGRCYELAAPPAYQPLVEVLRAQLPALRQTALPPLWQAELSRLLPELAAAGQPAGSPAPGDQQRLVEAIASALLSLARDASLLVLLEDAQWMDPASLDTLRFLLPRLGEAPLLVLISARNEELVGRPAAALAAMERTRLACRLELGRLDQAETAELVRRALAMEQTAPRFSARLHVETEGNPFFLLETLRALVQEGLLYRDGTGLWSTPWDDSTSDYKELPLPAGVAQSIAHRLERLPSAQRHLLQLAAVIGREVGFALWLAASGQEEDTLLVGADALCGSGLLLAAGPGRSGGADYAFGHDLIRRVCYEQMSGPRRRARHRRVAHALERLHPNEPAALAYHWTQAGEWDRAASDHQRAGDQARALYANAAAAAHYTQALEALERLPGPVDLQRRYALLLAREEVYDLLGEREAQAKDAQALTTLAEAMADEACRAEAALRRAHYADATGDYSEAVAVAQEAVRRAQVGHDTIREASGYLQWGQALYSLGRYEEAHARSEQALALAEAGQSPRLQAHSLRQLAAIAESQGDYARSEDLQQQALSIYRATRDSCGEGAILHNLGLVAAARGDHIQASDYLEQALHIYGEVGDRRSEGRTLLTLGRLSLQRNDYGGGKTHLERALNVFRDVGDRQSEGWALLNLGRTALMQGELAEANADCERARSIFEEISVRPGEALALVNLGSIHRQQGYYEQAMARLEKALDIGRDLGDLRGVAWGLHLLADVRADLGDYPQARAYLQQALEILRGLGDRLSEGWVIVDLAHLLCRLDDNESALDFSQQGMAMARELDDPLLRADGLLHSATALVGLDRPAEAIAAYQESLALRRRSSAPHLVAEPLAGLARVALGQGDLQKARQYVEELVRYMEEHAQPADRMHGLANTEEPFQVYLTCYEVLQALHDPRAATILAAAHGMLQGRATRIACEEERRSFLENVAAHRKIVRFHRDMLTSQEQRHQVAVSLPRAGTPRGRPLRPDEFVPVTWTVWSPEDEEQPGKVDRRRRRIVRLLAEAQAQGAAPRDEDLAAALGVSLPTLRRDMATLRARGHHLPSRGRGK